MTSVRKLVIIPAEDWSRMAKDNEDTMIGCPKEVDCGGVSSPPQEDPPPEEVEEEKKENVSPPSPLPPPQQGQEGEGKGMLDSGHYGPKSKTRKQWGPPGRPARVRRSKKWINV